jgi:hypothetical protein
MQWLDKHCFDHSILRISELDAAAARLEVPMHSVVMQLNSCYCVPFCQVSFSDGTGGDTLKVVKFRGEPLQLMIADMKDDTGQRVVSQGAD